MIAGTAAVADGVALFPISLSNQAFSTSIVLPLLEDLSARYDRLLFLVADRLQIYNRALRVQQDIKLGTLMRQFDSDQDYLEQRRVWIDRLATMIKKPLDDGHWRVIGIEDITDASCFRIFRNVMLLYYADPNFRADIDSLALDHAQTRNDKFLLETRTLLSRGYILEEIAISIRLHVGENITDEYYIGGQAEPILKLYENGYSVSVSDLAESDVEGSYARFFRNDPGNAEPCWTLEHIADS